MDSLLCRYKSHSRYQCLDRERGEVGGGGGTPLYKPYRYVPTHFGLELGMVFAGTTECMNVPVYIVSFLNELERKRNIRIRNGFEYFFCLPSIISNGNNFCLKARSGNGYEF